MRRWSKPGALAVATLAAMTLAALVPPAQASTGKAPTDTKPASVLRDAPPAPKGVSPGKPNPDLRRRSSLTNTNAATFSLRPKNADQKAKPKAAPRSAPVSGPSPAAEGDPYYCTAVIQTAVAQTGLDEFIEQTGHVDYLAEMGCNFYLDSVEGIAGVIDRSEPYYGEVFDGNVLGTGTYWYSEFDYYAYSEGSIDLRAKYYNGGRDVQAAFELYLLGPIGFVWDECNPIPDLVYLACEGLGTDYLHVVVGTSNFSTGLARACRNLGITGDPEQQRVEVPANNPVSTQILNKTEFATLKQQVADFRSGICAKNSGAEVASFAASEGQRLWDSAVSIAKAGGGGLNDDRGLYWARLAMTTTIAQYVRFAIPGDDAQRTNTQKALDRPSRGMTSHSFDRGTAKKAFISGFDPFGLFPDGLDGAPFSGNPSGASVLKLDNEIVNGAEVEAVIFPVRYDDFDEGLVEQVFGPHLAGGGQQATIVTTVSQGGSNDFELEIYNGRRRASFDASTGPLPDNRKKTNGNGTYTNPIVPPGLGGGSFTEFTQTTLPVDVLRPYGAVVDITCDEQAPPGSTSKDCVEGPRLNSLAVQGSGGGYLSNEIAYRVTSLRDRTGSTVPTGHVHTPFVSPTSGTGDPGFGAVASRYRSILELGVTAPAAPPVTVSVDNTTYRVGDTPTYTVTAEVNTVIKWSSTKDGAPTGELDRVYTTPVALGPTDITGRWTGPGDRAWTDADVGTWVKYVRVNGRLAQVAFTVIP